MKLADYLVTNRLTASEFAELIGGDKSSVGRWIKPDAVSRPRWEYLAKIVEVTNGQVTPNDFLDLPEDDEPDEPNGQPPDVKCVNATPATERAA